MLTKRDMAYERLLGLIVSGHYEAGEKLPSEPELSKHLGVARVTLRSALSRLEQENIISRSRATGTVVLPRFRESSRIVVLTVGDNPENISDPTIYSLRGILNEAQGKGWEVNCISHSIANKIDWENMRLRGIIICANRFDSRVTWLKKLQEAPFPKVLVHGFERDFKVTGFAAVRTDYAQAWHQGLKHLTDLGHRRIVLMNIYVQELFRRNRMSPKQMLQALHSLGAEPDPDLLFFLEHREIESVVKSIVKMNKMPTAIYCYSDFWAIELFKILKKYHIRVPEDIAVMGFGGIWGSEFTQPKLSTVDLGYERQGRLAVELLSQSSEWQNNAAKPIITAPSVIAFRQSTDRFIINY